MLSCGIATVTTLYLKSGVSIRVMIGKVAHIILMTEACTEGQRVIRLSLLTTSCNGTPSKMIPAGGGGEVVNNCTTARDHYIRYNSTAIISPAVMFSF